VEIKERRNLMKNDEIRELLIKGITEEYFIENFDVLMDFIGFKIFNPYDPATKELASLKRSWMPSILERIYRMNPTRNKWADINNISESLKVFLKLKGEDV
jgi:hypothetical protein